MVNELSAMKVNTDGVLLGAAMTLLPTDRRLLDVGTGTGTIALMASQRLSDLLHNALIQPATVNDSIVGQTSLGVHSTIGETSIGVCRDYFITGIDIDEPSAKEAAVNFTASPWSDHLEAKHTSLQDYFPAHAGENESTSSPESVDLIFSNPPYFDNSLEAPDARRSGARHTSSLSYRDIFTFAERVLTESGRVSLVLPADTEHDLCRYARMCGLFPFRILRIKTVARKAPGRIIAEFSRSRSETIYEELVINEAGGYSDAYKALTADFYVNL